MDAGEHFLFSKTLMNRYRICLSLVPVFCLLRKEAGRDIGSIRAPDSTDPDAYADCCKACAAQYSESKPNPPRRRSAADKFPGIGDGTGTPDADNWHDGGRMTTTL
ncbi:MAG: hypothetical protein M9893_12225 [Pyrinomonadaceae bacterium]|nr:hypothetical protein [Pyrinomonadaceae bacterium]